MTIVIIKEFKNPRYIRHLLDSNKNCVSCGRKFEDWEGGEFLYEVIHDDGRMESQVDDGYDYVNCKYSN